MKQLNAERLLKDDDDGIKVAASFTSFSVSCDDNASAAPTYLSYCKERSVEMKNEISEYFCKKKKQKKLLDFYYVK